MSLHPGLPLEHKIGLLSIHPPAWPAITNLHQLLKEDDRLFAKLVFHGKIPSADRQVSSNSNSTVLYHVDTLINIGEGTETPREGLRRSIDPWKEQTLTYGGQGGRYCPVIWVRECLRTDWKFQLQSDPGLAKLKLWLCSKAGQADLKYIVLVKHALDRLWPQPWLPIADRK